MIVHNRLIVGRDLQLIIEKWHGNDDMVDLAEGAEMNCSLLECRRT
jgi:hypothetical protein